MVLQKKKKDLCVCVEGKCVTTGRVVYVRGWDGVENDGGDSGKKGDQNKEYILLHLSCSLCWRLLLLKWRTWSGTFFQLLKRYLKKEKKKRNEWMDKAESGLLVPEFLEPALVLKDGCAFIEGMSLKQFQQSVFQLLNETWCKNLNRPKWGWYVYVICSFCKRSKSLGLLLYVMLYDHKTTVPLHNISENLTMFTSLLIYTPSSTDKLLNTN